MKGHYTGQGGPFSTHQILHLTGTTGQLSQDSEEHVIKSYRFMYVQFLQLVTNLHFTYSGKHFATPVLVLRSMTDVEIFFSRATTASMLEQVLKCTARSSLADHYPFGNFIQITVIPDLSAIKASSSKEICLVLVSLVIYKWNFSHQLSKRHYNKYIGAKRREVCPFGRRKWPVST